MQTETNSSKSYEVSTKIILTSFSKFHDSKPFSRMDRDDVIAYLDSFRKSEKIDPLHKWIGTYVTLRIDWIKYFDRHLTANMITSILDSEFMYMIGPESDYVDGPNKYFIHHINNESKILVSIALFERM